MATTICPEIFTYQTIRGVIDRLVEHHPATSVHVVRYYMIKDLRSCYIALNTGVQTPEMIYGANAAETLANMIYDSTTGSCPGNTPDAVDGLCAALQVNYDSPCQAVADICNDVLHFLRQRQLYRALDRVCRAVAVRGQDHNDSFATHLADINGNDEDDDAFDVDSREFRPIVRKTAASARRGRGRPPRKDATAVKELERAKRLHAITFGAGAAPDVKLR